MQVCVAALPEVRVRRRRAVGELRTTAHKLEMMPVVAADARGCMTDWRNICDAQDLNGS